MKYNPGEVYDSNTGQYIIENIFQRNKADGTIIDVATIRFLQTGTTQQWSFSQLDYGFPKDEYYNNKKILGVAGSTNNNAKENNPKLWKLWIDTIYSLYDKDSSNYPNYGGKGLEIKYDKMLNFKGFCDYVAECEKIGFPIIDKNDMRLYKQQMARIITK